MTTTPQGWYQDPNDESIVRWWDGQQWTSHTETRVATPQAPDQPAAAPRGGGKRPKPKLFGKGQALDEAYAEVERLQGELTRLGAMDVGATCRPSASVCRPRSPRSRSRSLPLGPTPTASVGSRSRS